MALSDAVAAQIMGELHTLTKGIEEQTEQLAAVADKVEAAAQSVNSGRTALHRQNEAFLVEQVKQITKSVDELKSINGDLQQTARKHIDSVLSPTVTALSESLKNQMDRENSAWKVLNRAMDYMDQSKRIGPYLIAGIVVGMLVAFGFGFWCGSH